MVFGSKRVSQKKKCLFALKRKEGEREREREREWERKKRKTHWARCRGTRACPGSGARTTWWAGRCGRWRWVAAAGSASTRTPAPGCSAGTSTLASRSRWFAQMCCWKGKQKQLFFLLSAVRPKLVKPNQSGFFKRAFNTNDAFPIPGVARISSHVFAKFKMNLILKRPQGDKISQLSSSKRWLLHKLKSWCTNFFRNKRRPRSEHWLEDSDEQVDEQNVGDDEIDGHDGRSDPATRNALVLCARSTIRCKGKQRSSSQNVRTNAT